MLKCTSFAVLVTPISVSFCTNRAFLELMSIVKFKLLFLYVKNAKEIFLDAGLG